MKKIFKWFTLAAASALTCVMLVACTPSNLEKASDKMAKEGYKVTELKGDSEEGCVGGISATKANLDFTNMDFEGDTITAYLFESKKDAEAYVNDVKENWGEDYSPVQDGKWVYWGTEDAIEDFTD
ncbi:MAG: hypothetical protein IJ329_04485 [Clostridia bacterium]|nr:hypothetical protein [Clostridia bacterium]